MRVLESKPVGLHVMGRRKHKLRKRRDVGHGSDSSDDGMTADRACSHLHKSINFNAVKKAIKESGGLGECTSCSKLREQRRRGPCEASPALANTSNTDDVFDEAETTIWVCLQCGHQGCDRNSQHKHSLKHYETPRSAKHAVVVNIETWMTWCYDCDNEVLPECSRKLQECIDHLLKQSGLPSKIEHVSTQPTGRKGSSGRHDSNEQLHQETTAERDSKALSSATSLNISNLSLSKVKGLNNLGNTCFFNAVMQNLSQTPFLEAMLAERTKKGTGVYLDAIQSDNGSSSEEDNDMACQDNPTLDNGKKVHYEPLKVSMAEGGVLTQSVLTFLGEMSSPCKGGTYNPGGLFSQVCRKAPRFKGYQQQDSHELLRYLLDGMRAEEIKRAQSGILRAFQLPENVNPRKVDDETKMKIKAYGKHAKHTFVDAVFGGYFISTVLCEECRVPSQIFEPFLDISLPITEEKTVRHNSGSGSRKKDGRGEEDEKGLGADVPATSGTRPSKHALKNARKMARKEAKRKWKLPKEKFQALDTAVKGDIQEDDNDSTPGSSPLTAEPNPIAACQNLLTAKEDNLPDDGIENKMVNDSMKVQSEVEKNNTDSLPTNGDNWGSSSEGEPGDADIEDNIESDVVRHRLGMLDGGQYMTNQIVMNGDLVNSVNNLSTPLPDHYTKDECPEAEESTAAAAGDSQETTHNKTHPDESDMNHADDVNNLTVGMENIKISGDAVNLATNLDSTVKNMDDDTATRCLESTTPETEATKIKAATSIQSKSSKIRSSKWQLKQDAKMRATLTLAHRYQAVSHECSVMSCLNQFTAAELLTGNNKFGCENCSRKRQGKQKTQNELIYTSASKQVLIFCPPAVLTLHLKRFQQVGFRLQKVNRYVEFPKLLDLAPYCSALCQGAKPKQSKVIYSLYGVVEHSGRLTSGHYTAYVKVRPVSSTNKLQKFLQKANMSGLKLEKVLADLETKRQEAEDKSPVECEEPDQCPGKWYYISDSRVNEVTNEDHVMRCQAYILFYERIF